MEGFRERKRWKIFGFPFTFTVYSGNGEIITVDKGFFNKVEDDIYIYKVVDVKLRRSLAERMFGTGTVVCYTSDITDKILEIQHIKNSMEVKNFILKKSEEARIKRRTVNMQNISGNLDLDGADLDNDGVLDDIFN